MRLRALKRHWDRLARQDPLWAVLTDPGKRDGGWDVDQFFQAGTEELSAVLQRAERLGVVVSRRRALDFGCGVGRVTQAMAGSFERCDGVDISASMLRLARRHNRDPARCFYHLNVADDLARFPDASFTFVFSTLVLQHMAPAYSKGYIKELLRVLAPGGLLVFQLPSHRTAHLSSDHTASHTMAARLPLHACRARIAAEPTTLLLQADQQVDVKVTVENCSSSIWPALPDRRGRFQIKVANHWLTEAGVMFARDDGRCPLPHDMPPASRVDVMLGVTVPRIDGLYSLEVDLVQENVCWFADRGSPVLRIPCRVVGGLPGTSSSPRAAPIDAAAERPFRERHPKVFHVLRVTRLRDVYWTWRRGLDAVKRSRDRLIVSAMEAVYVPLRDRVHGDLIAPMINWWRRGPFAARMEMHCVPRSEVVSILASGGGHVVDVEEELFSRGYLSCRYWVCKDGAGDGSARESRRRAGSHER
jgi:ubiquinone/menaquinone biosynthesis C-methylase UbiE